MIEKIKHFLVLVLSFFDYIAKHLGIEAIEMKHELINLMVLGHDAKLRSPKLNVCDV